MKAAHSPNSLATLGENGLLHLLTSRWKTDARVLTGVGDDCAVLRGEGKNHFLIFKTDAVVEGVHFKPSEKPELIGRKALARALSDLAAMGAVPLAAVVTLGLPKDESVARLRKIYAGMERIARKHAVNLVGGETTRAKQLFLNVALLGECRGYQPVLRSTARVGDAIFVTGKLGGTQAAAASHLRAALKRGPMARAAPDRDRADGPERRPRSRPPAPSPRLRRQLPDR